MDPMKTEQLRQWLDEKKDFLLINVLSAEDFEQKHIPGSLHVPVSADDFVEKVTRQAGGDKSATIVVYCASESCDASPKAAKKLDQAGFTDVFDYEAGIAGWEAAGQPLATARSRA